MNLHIVPDVDMTLPMPEPSVDAVLAAAIWDDTAARRVLADLPAELVQGGPRTALVDALTSLVDDGTTVEPSTVLARLVDQQHPGWDDAVRDLPRLVTERAPSVTLGWHLDRLTDKALRIRLLAVSTGIAQAADADDPHDGLLLARDRLERLDLGATTAPPTLADLTDAYLTELEVGNTTRSIPTGIDHLDTLLGGGLRAGQLVVVGARPGVGKSNLLGDLARAAVRNDQRVLWHTLEMPRGEVMDRHTAAVAHVDLTRLLGRAVTEDDWTRIARTHDAIHEPRLYIEDQPSVTVADIAKRARGTNPDLLLIDYLQLIQPAKPSGSRQEDVAGLSRALKLLARDLRCPVIVAAQLNRNPTGRNDPTPRLSDLRESGAIEADADVVILLDRDDEDETQGTTARLIVAKNRGGPTGRVELAFIGQYATFGPLTFRPAAWSEGEAS